MVREIRIYIEGDRSLRVGFGQFFDRVRGLARHKRIGWNIILCGSRDASFDAFKTAIQTHPNSFNMLLVDAEGPVAQTPWQHLNDRDRWDKPHGVDDDHCDLMVQTMEAWFIADLVALEKYYGQKFNSNRIPKRNNVEEIDKDKLLSILQEATRSTSKKGYHKVKHAPSLLERLNEEVVRSKSRHGERLFAMLERIIDAHAPHTP